MIEGMVEAIWTAKEKGAEQYPVRSNQVSKLGHPCLRYLVYHRTRYAERPPLDARTLFIFSGGPMIENMAHQQLTQGGFELLEKERNLELLEFKQLEIHGRCDFKIVDPTDRKKRYPLEVKGMNDYTWQKIDTIDDLKKSPRPYLQAYPAQLQLYMLMSDSEFGCFYLVNKTNYQPKVLWAELDMDYCEELLQKAATINKHMADETLPDRIEFSPEACEYCDYALICLESRDYGEGIKIIDNPEVLELLQIRDENAEARKQYEDADKAVKKKLKDIPMAQCGPFLITGKVIEKKGFTGKPSQYWKATIKKLDTTAKTEE